MFLLLLPLLLALSLISHRLAWCLAHPATRTALAVSLTSKGLGIVAVAYLEPPTMRFEASTGVLARWRQPRPYRAHECPVRRSRKRDDDARVATPETRSLPQRAHNSWGHGTHFPLLDGLQRIRASFSNR
uniref:Putative secreted protein n=1 Tax=Anopheles triannulatus TaxID=58253 RepID=A0A2M4B1P3_9DIPT